jgi:hypothetical protein
MKVGTNRPIYNRLNECDLNRILSRIFEWNEEISNEPSWAEECKLGGLYSWRPWFAYIAESILPQQFSHIMWYSRVWVLADYKDLNKLITWLCWSGQNSRAVPAFESHRRLWASGILLAGQQARNCVMHHYGSPANQFISFHRNPKIPSVKIRGKSRAGSDGRTPGMNIPWCQAQRLGDEWKPKPLCSSPTYKWIKLFVSLNLGRQVDGKPSANSE